MDRTLFLEYVRRTVLAEVDVLAPQDDPRQGGVSRGPEPEPRKVDISPGYKRKENTRDKVQKTVAKKVQAGGISDEEDLKRYLSDEKRVRSDGRFEDDDDVSLALTALRMVPLSVWRQLR